MENEERITFKPFTTALSGIAFSFFILLIGYTYTQINNTQVTLIDNQNRVLIGIITNGLSFGYWFGLSIKNNSNYKGLNLFWMSFFGTFCVVLILLGFYNKLFYVVASLLAAIITPALFIYSGIIEDPNLKFFKKSLKSFSEGYSKPVITAYLFSSYYKIETYVFFILIIIFIIVYYIYRYMTREDESYHT